MKLILNQLIHVEKLFALEDLNRKIANFAYGISDRKNRPSLILKVSDVAKNHRLQQKAMQFWCLFRLLPFFIGDRIPIGHPFWEFFVELRQIADYLFAQKWTKNMVICYKLLYQQHLKTFLQLFPSFRLIPKHHFLLHYGDFVLKSGPPYQNMVACHEMK